MGARSLAVGSAAAAVVAAALAFASAMGYPSLAWGAVAAAAGAAVAASAAGRRAELSAIDMAVAESAAARAGLEAVAHRAALDDLADGLDVMVFLCQHDGTIEYANLRAVETFRFPDPEGKTVLSVTLSHELAELVADVAETNAAKRAELAFHHPSQIVAAVQAWPLSDGERLFISLYDITELRRLEAVRRDFVANVSHEVRTPLANVRLSAETAQDSLDDPELVERSLSRVISEVDRLVRITDDLLTLSRVEAARGEREPVDFGKLVTSVAGSFRRRADEKGVEFEVEAEPGIEVFGDQVQLSQVVSNLVDNALAYTQSGRVSVHLSNSADGAELIVSDTGIGIASEHIPRIFERFYRADKARSRETGGTGLGLSIVRNIVEAHGGTVRVESELNRGSAFTVVLPTQAD